MGCAVKKVIKSGSGVALMKNPERVKEILRKVRKSINLPFTVKIRSGWDSQSINALEIAKIAEGEGVDGITIHPRTKEQMFSGISDWSLIKTIKKQLRIPVIGNGDIKNCYDAKRMFEVTGCDAVMVGRGALGRPWIFTEITQYLNNGKIPKKFSHQEIEKVLLEHLNLSMEHFGEKRGINLMKKHISWYTKGLCGGNLFREKINLIKEKGELISAIKEFFMALSS